MKHIVLFGAGKSATVLINYLKEIALENIWKLTVADSNLQLAAEKVGTNNPLATAIQIDIENTTQRQQLIQQASIVISMMPPNLHYLIAVDCLQYSKHLLTASYIDAEIKKLEPQIQEKKLLFLCEMGLDPGIDHMSAMKIIDGIQKAGGTIQSFKSHCGGLIAPESDDNPWHYKISWNPKNIILAGKAGATFKKNNQTVFLPYEQLFNANTIITVTNNDAEEEVYAYYPNRDSLSYIPLYKLHNANTFIRTTLRHIEFCYGWKNIVDLKLTNEDKIYDTTNMTISDFFHAHFEKNGFSNWLSDMMLQRLTHAKEMMDKLMSLMEAEEEAEKQGEDIGTEMMLINDKGELDTINIEETKEEAAEAVAVKMHEANLSMRQLFYLGLDDESFINKGLCSAADILQNIVEKKLALQPHDKDMIVMVHEFEYTTANNQQKYLQSVLKIIGKNNLETAMAATVGLPLGIAAKLILEEKITAIDLKIPIDENIYNPVLKELEQKGICFKEFEKNL